MNDNFVTHTPAAKTANLVSGMRRTRSREQSGATHHQDGGKTTHGEERFDILES